VIVKGKRPGDGKKESPADGYLEAGIAPFARGQWLGPGTHGRQRAGAFVSKQRLLRSRAHPNTFHRRPPLRSTMGAGKTHSGRRAVAMQQGRIVAADPAA